MVAKSDLVLPDSVSSTADLQTVINEIKGYARWAAHVAIKKKVKAKGGKSTPAPAVSPAAQQLINQVGSSENFDGLIAQLEAYAAKAPQFTIILAAPASGSLKKSLLGWCRANVAPNVMVNFQFNSTILGGLVVRSGSHVYDWSFRRQILESAAKFPEILKNV